MGYLDFELEISVGTERQYPVAVMRSTGGEAHESMLFPFDKIALENQLLRPQNVLLHAGGRHHQILPAEEQVVQNFSHVLLNTHSTGDVRSRCQIMLSKPYSRQ